MLDHVQIGIMSFGPRNCSEGMPSVYMRVSEYSEWISEHTLEDGTIKMYNIWLIAIILTAIFCVLYLVLNLEKNFLILKKYYRRVKADYA